MAAADAAPTFLVFYRCRRRRHTSALVNLDASRPLQWSTLRQPLNFAVGANSATRNSRPAKIQSTSFSLKLQAAATSDNETAEQVKQTRKALIQSVGGGM